MLFYPLDFWGFALKRWPENPLGLFGWQGIVPCKAELMSGRIVDMVTTKVRIASREARGVLSPCGARVAYDLRSLFLLALALSICVSC